MIQYKYINKYTLKDLEDYLKLTSPPGLILNGIQGLGKDMVAEYLSSKLLKCDIGVLTSHPDYFCTQKEKPVKVDDINAVLDFTNRISIGERKVIVIYNAHTMTISTQNRLLKLLEDRSHKNILILITEKDLLIGTIKSRCYSISMRPLNQAAMNDYLKEHKIKDAYIPFLTYLIDSAPLSFERNQDVIEDYCKCYDKLKQLSMRKDILNIFHQIKEKDTSDFFTSHSHLIDWNIRLILFPFYEYLIHINEDKQMTFPSNLYSYEEIYQIIEYGMGHLKLSTQNYTKNDYFNLLRYIIQI